ncbi:hypothetical protein Ahy_A09g044172 [Arachis hypogaea]|uniref:Alcohol dehydrogenase-like C-terminal domain-containing protein n=1 Tax=Arachis hypogaea TaxID=3818 RepID=A0A445BJP0_ARAHY|nr:hypothetical protein Ahy_A09g044172 [Arachis hypogaea]
MGKKPDPVITKCKEGENWTKVTFKPDLEKFKMVELEEDVVVLMKNGWLTWLAALERLSRSFAKIGDRWEISALTITNGIRRAAIEEAKARHSLRIPTATPPPLAPPSQSPQTLARPPTPPPPPLSQDEVVTKQRNKDEVRTMFESYRRIKLFLSKKEGDFIHDLEQSFFALVNASRVFSTNVSKEDETLNLLSAYNYVISSDQDQMKPILQAGNGAIADRTPECWKDFPCKCCCSKYINHVNNLLAVDNLQVLFWKAELEEIRKKGFKGVENGDNAADEKGQRLVQENKEENEEVLKSLEPLLATEEDRKFWYPLVEIGVTLGVPKVNPEMSTHYGLFLMGRTLKGYLFGGWKPKSDLPLLVEKYVNKEIQIDDYITYHVPFDDINNAFDLMKEGKCLRCVIHMPR